MPPLTMADRGALDRQITLQQVTESTETSGFPTEAWSTLATVFARKQDMSGRERFVAGQMTAPFDTGWVIPYRTDMDPDEIDVPKKRRLVYKGRVFDIVYAQMIGRYEGIALQTLAGGTVS